MNLVSCFMVVKKMYKTEIHIYRVHETETKSQMYHDVLVPY